MIWFSIVEAIVIALLVGCGCFSWGKSKARDEQYKREQQEKDAKSKQDFQERAIKQYEILAKQNDKEIRLIKSITKNHNIKLNNVQIKGIQFMLKEKYGCIPIDPNEIYNFIKQNVLDIKEQE